MVKRINPRLFPLFDRDQIRQAGFAYHAVTPDRMPLISVIIPVLNDAAALRRALDALVTDGRVEVIVVNGGRRDREMLAMEQEWRSVRWLVSGPGRGRQMNFGAREARGEWLLFLHADTRLSPGWIDELAAVADDDTIVGGSFRFRLDVDSWWARAIERGVAIRVRVGNLPFGDQALFVRRGAFAALDGYAEWPLMEDVDLVRRLRHSGRLHHSRRPAVTSARRWEADGWMHRSARNVALLLLFFAGVSPAWLARHYQPRRGRGASDAPIENG